MPDPLLLDFPDKLESERLIIRAPRPGDGRAHYEAVAESIGDLRRFPASLAWAMAAPSVESSEIYCRSAFANFVGRKDLPFLLLDRSSGAVVGGSGLHRFNWAVPKFEVGFWCRSSFQGKGLITEAVGVILMFAFERLGARRVEAFPDELNTASCRVCERVGLELEGTMRNERADPDGTLRNTRVYAKVR
jgi:RimJ/RimL family protein N-acetyltransferase